MDSNFLGLLRNWSIAENALGYAPAAPQTIKIHHTFKKEQAQHKQTELLRD